MPIDKESSRERPESLLEQSHQPDRIRSLKKTDIFNEMTNDLRNSTDHKVFTEIENESSKEKIVEMHSKGTET